jgi:CheY-like chemotaxis protein
MIRYILSIAWSSLAIAKLYRAWDGLRSIHGVRLCEANGRPCEDLQRGGPGHDDQDLPAALPWGTEAEVEASTLAEAPRAESGETVLVVEDEPVVRSLTIEVLEDLGYRTLEAADGPEGLKILQSRQDIDLLVTDVGLPGLNGRQLADAAREGRPDLKVLFITGYAENATLAAGFLEPGLQMITKPFAVDELAQKIRDVRRPSAQSDPIWRSLWNGYHRLSGRKDPTPNHSS